MSDSERCQVEVEIVNPTGLHTRPAKEFVQVANGFTSTVEVSKGGQSVNGKSIMGLMSLLAPQGTRLTITAIGQDAEAAVRALEEVVSKRFGEVE